MCVYVCVSILQHDRKILRGGCDLALYLVHLHDAVLCIELLMCIPYTYFYISMHTVCILHIYIFLYLHNDSNVRRRLVKENVDVDASPSVSLVFFFNYTRHVLLAR